MTTVLKALGVGLLVVVAVAFIVLRDTGHRPTGAGMASATSHDHHAAPAGATVDWSRVSDRDLDIAELFVLARRNGVREALDRLEVLASGDTALHSRGHVIAHALGRFGVAQRHGDPGVYAECRELFQAGCYHGVMEAYFASPRAADSSAVAPASLNSLCTRIVRPGAARLVTLECAHGMGHGLVTRYHGDVQRALGGCDHLTQREARAECHDGVFMENAVRATASPDIRVGDAALDAAATGGTHPPLVRRGDLTYPCAAVAASYQGACWKYQPIIIAEAARGDYARTLEVCGRAPSAYRGDCFFGIGKQASGWWSDEAHVARLCERVTGDPRVFCVAGAVDSYLDEMWTADRALAFCRAVASDAKRRCYRTLGSRLAVMRTEYASIQRECARAEPGFESECVDGVAQVWLRATGRSRG